MGALAIPTKITKGTIEIIKDVDIIKAGDRVGMSEATLLNMLKISPFSYGLVISKVYDSGSVFDPEILDMTDADLLAKFQTGVRNVAAMSLAMNYQRCLGASQHRQRHEEPAGHCRCHRDYLQGGWDRQGLPCRSQRLR